MPDKDTVQAVLDAIGVTRAGRSESRRGRCDDDECVAPDNVIYVILCNCVTINNGACEDWDLCDTERHCPD